MVSLWGYVTHVISRTRPSRFSACNIEKAGSGLACEATTSPDDVPYVVEAYIKFHCTRMQALNIQLSCTYQKIALLDSVE